jgi:hypothetical protein
MIIHLREEALNRTRNTYPNTLDGWDKIHHNVDEPIPNGIDDAALSKMEDLWSLAQVSHQSHLYSAISAIYLEIAAFGNANILYEFNLLTTNLPRTFPEINLSGNKNLILYQRIMIFSWLGKTYIPPAGCKQPEGCRLARLVAAQERFVTDMDLHLFGQSSWQASLAKDLCNACKADAKRVYNEGLSKHWDFVPKAFGLGTWTELTERTEKEAKLVTDSNP